jgi:p21-activated kinase 1
MGMVHQNSPGLYLPAANESNSPIIPITPGLLGRPFRDDSFIQMDAEPNEVRKRDKEVVDEENEEEEDSLDEELERDPNRDSNTSTASVSTVSTVTVATVVRQASVAKRAVANVIRPLQPWARGQGSPRDMQMVAEEEEPGPLSAVELKIPDMPFSGSSSIVTSGRSSWSSPQYSPFSTESSTGSSTSDPLPAEDEREFYPEGDPNQDPKTPAYLSFLEPSPIPSKTDFPTDSMLTLKARPETIGIMLSEEDLTSPQRQMLAANGELFP